MKEWIYSNSPDNKERYVLGKSGDKTLLCIGINPSTAVPEKLDNTLKRVNSFSTLLGYDSWLMLNIYPQRATNPNDLHLDLNVDSHRRNIEAIRTTLLQFEFDVWPAWGTLINKRPYLHSCLSDIASVIGLEKEWINIGTLTKDGHPRHPLYIRNESFPSPFDIKTYISSKQ